MLVSRFNLNISCFICNIFLSFCYASKMDVKELKYYFDSFKKCVKYRPVFATSSV